MAKLLAFLVALAVTVGGGYYWWNQRTEILAQSALPSRGKFFADARHASECLDGNIRKSTVLAVDLDGMGVKATYAKRQWIYFDYDGDEFRELTNWIGRGDAFLVFDADGDGRIGSGAELVGPAKDSCSEVTPLEALDKDGDGVIDAASTEGLALALWQDANRDGNTDPGELHPLRQAPFSRLVRDGSGTWRGDAVQAVTLSGNVMQTRYGPEVQVTMEAFRLPMVRGYGIVQDLPPCCMTNPGLKAKVEQALKLESLAELQAAMDEIFVLWTGADAVPADAMQGAFSARRLWVLECFTGRPYWQKNSQTTEVHRNAVPYLEDSYEAMRDHALAMFASYTVLDRLLPGVRHDQFMDVLTFSRRGSDLEQQMALALARISPEDADVLGRIILNEAGDDGVLNGASVDGVRRRLPQDRVDCLRSRKHVKR